jgi:Fis family transcriptional regulator
VNRVATRKDNASANKKTAGGIAAGHSATAPAARLDKISGANGSARTAPAARPAQAAAQTGESLEQCVFRSLDQYFSNLDGAKPHALHEMVLGAIEKPLLQFALQRCEGNQSAAADLLGINRNTLRRKLQDYGLH